ncbi:hypothetical protein PoB_004257300 [Plakobranchus ocellatus]|uniref:Uncharacterized protein n=1 Tax=Plakobranchus ocellatus TaxID=259542 RepID=A0AAV4BA83_9GAST|nr:hypothetical protein PoB_004257300 [Plakobranchus ocellatus]
MTTREGPRHRLCHNVTGTLGTDVAKAGPVLADIPGEYRVRARFGEIHTEKVRGGNWRVVCQATSGGARTHDRRAPANSKGSFSIDTATHFPSLMRLYLTVRMTVNL